MRQWETVLYSVIRPDEDFPSALGDALNELNISVPEFCEDTSLSESTVYKILSGHRENIQLNNFREIVKAMKALEQGEDSNHRTVGIITNRESLERVPESFEFDGVKLKIEGYPSSTVEEAIRQSILAERDSVDAIICGPITAYTVENVIHTPVVGLDIKTEQIEDAVETALLKTQ